MQYFITAIGTDSGKTLVSAILCEALYADYWKPIQAGLPRDTDIVKSLVSNPTSQFHQEAYAFKTAASPHAAAALDNVVVDLTNLNVPVTSNDLIIEGAGGCLVPINNHHFVIDLAVKTNAKVILVSNLYLGSINHTLLTYEALVKRKISIAGIIFNGQSNPESERIILHHTKLPCLLKVSKETKVDKETIKRYATQLRESWKR